MCCSGRGLILGEYRAVLMSLRISRRAKLRPLESRPRRVSLTSLGTFTNADIIFSLFQQCFKLRVSAEKCRECSVNHCQCVSVSPSVRYFQTASCRNLSEILNTLGAYRRRSASRNTAAPRHAVPWLAVPRWCPCRRPASRVLALVVLASRDTRPMACPRRPPRSPGPLCSRLTHFVAFYHSRNQMR